MNFSGNYGLKFIHRKLSVTWHNWSCAWFVVNKILISQWTFFFKLRSEPNSGEASWFSSHFKGCPETVVPWGIITPYRGLNLSLGSTRDYLTSRDYHLSLSTLGDYHSLERFIISHSVSTLGDYYPLEDLITSDYPLGGGGGAREKCPNHLCWSTSSYVPVKLLT